MEVYTPTTGKHIFEMSKKMSTKFCRVQNSQQIFFRICKKTKQMSALNVFFTYCIENIVLCETIYGKCQDVHANFFVHFFTFRNAFKTYLKTGNICYLWLFESGEVWENRHLFHTWFCSFFTTTKWVVALSTGTIHTCSSKT